MRVQGACHCGAIAFEGEVDRDSVGICHCADCQALSGSPYRAAVATRPGSFALTRGEPKIYVKTADSGARRAHAFCSECGSPVYSCAAENPTSYSLRLGTLKQRYDLRPRRQIWAMRRLRWVADLTDIPAVEGQPARP